MKSGSPIIDPINFTTDHVDHVSKYTWDFPNDLDPSGIKDYKIIYISCMSYLMTHLGTKTTLLAATSEIEKFLQWIFHEKKKSPFILNESEILAFLDFTKKPHPAWVSSSAKKKFIVSNGNRIPNPAWRPFREARSSQKNSNTLKKTFTFISGYYKYCRRKKIIKSNPFDFISKKSLFPKLLSSKNIAQKILHAEDRELLELTLDGLVKEDSRYTRERFIIIAMLNMYLRVSDLAEYRDVIPVMGDFYYRRTDNWWFVVYGKGNKQDDIAVNNKVIRALQDYRVHMGLSKLPYASEETPLILMRGGKKAIRSTRHIRDLISVAINKTIENAVANEWDKTDIERLKSFTAHWLRHTGISDGAIHRPIDHVRRDARHSSLATTSIYIESEDSERHNSSNL